MNDEQGSMFYENGTMNNEKDQILMNNERWTMNNE